MVNSAVAPCGPPVTPNYTAMNYGGGAGPHALTSAAADDGPHAYQYDGAGNMIRETLDQRVLNEFQYDAAGHMFFRRSEPFETNGYDYFYNNSDGSLVRRVKVGATAEDVIYVGDLYERKLSGTTETVTKYYYADGRRIAMRVGSTLYFLAADHLGGTAVVMNTSGGQVNRVRYYPFGNVRTQEGGTPVTDRLFTGQQRLSENGIYNYGARSYNAMTGRFLQADAIVPGPGNPQALNRYSYVLNNPMRYTDPSGYCALPLCDEVVSGAEAMVSGIETVGEGIVNVGVGVYNAGRGPVVDSWEWSWRQTRAAYRRTSGAVVDSWMYTRRTGSAVGHFVADYTSDKGQDIAAFAAVTAANPGTFPQNTLALGISLGSVGNRDQGEFGFALYRDCKGLCTLLHRGMGLDDDDAFTPGFLGFGGPNVSRSTFRHENQHAMQSLMLGPLYLPAIGVSYGYAVSGYPDEVFEPDADRARDQGIHIPFLP